jgi:hypothetical protein
MPYSIDNAYRDLEEVWSNPPREAYSSVIAISDVMKDVGMSDDDRARWSETAAERLLSLELPADAFFHPEPLDAPRAALIFSLDDRELRQLPPDTRLPNLLKVRLGGANIDWNREAPRSWPRLRSLTVRPGAGSSQGLFRWLSQQHLPALRELVAASCEVTSEDFDALLRAPFWPSLERVVLSNNALGPGGAPWPSTMAIRRLALDHVEADDASLASLLASSLPALEELDVSGNPIDVGGLATLVAAPLPALRSLSARGNAYRHRPIWNVLARSFWPNLQHLDIAGNGSNANELASAGSIFASVSSLDLSSCALGDAGTEALASLPFSRLGALSLAYNVIGVVGARTLAAAPFPDLEAIDLSVNNFGDEGLRALTSAPWWPRVRRLSLINVGFTDAALELLARCPPRAAEALDIGTRSFSNETVTRLRASLSPHTRLG